MRYLTMVARHGDPKSNANLMNYTLIGDDFSIHTMSGDKLTAAINDGKIKVVNMAVSSKGLVSTNGAIDKYTTIDRVGNIVGTPRFVILNRIEKNGKLHSYVVFTNTGVVANISVSYAADLAGKGLIANGKVRHTSEGDIVSAIGGNYPLIAENIKPKKDEPPVIDLVFFGSAAKDNSIGKYAGVTVTSKSANALANLHTKLVADNSKIIEELVSLGMDKEDLKSFEIKQAPGAGFYGVYSLDAVKKLIKAGKVKCSIRKLMIACRDLKDMDSPESIVLYDVRTGSITNTQSGTDFSDKKLMTYVKSVKALLDTDK